MDAFFAWILVPLLVVMNGLWLYDARVKHKPIPLANRYAYVAVNAVGLSQIINLWESARWWIYPKEALTAIAFVFLGVAAYRFLKKTAPSE